MAKARKMVAFSLFLLTVLFSANLFAGNGVTSDVSKTAVLKAVARLQMPFIVNQGQVDEQVRFYANTFGGTVFVTNDGAIIYSLPEGRGRDVPAGASQQGGKVVSGWHGQAPLVHAESEFVAANAYSPLLRTDNAHCPPERVLAKLLLAAYLPGLPVETTRRVVSASSLLPNSDSNVVPATYHPHSEIQNPQSPIGGVALKEHLVGGKIGEISGDAQSVTKVSYFKGNDPSKWKSNVSTYEVVDMGEVYDGISLSLKAYSNNVEKLFTIMPNANPEAIKLGLCGAKALKVSKEGQLEVETELGIVTFSKPVAYQEIDGKRVFVAVEYGIHKSTIGGQDAAVGGVDAGEQGGIQNPKPETRNSKLIYGFKVASYDKSRELVIDPLLASTFLGETDVNCISSIADDSQGNIYVTGNTNSSRFPTTPGAYDTSYNGRVQDWGYTDNDVFVSKLSGDLTTLLASTYLGGSSEDVSHSIAIDSDGNVYLTGNTSSSNFPTTPGAYDTSFLYGIDVFISKLDGDLKTLLASTFLGGSLSIGSDLVISPDKSVYVVGSTILTDIRPTDGAYDTSHNGLYDAFVARLNEGLTALLAFTFLGGGDKDFGDSLAMDSGGNIYVEGYTRSGNFPTTSGAYDTSYNGLYDAFISKLDRDLKHLVASTYLGGTSNEYSWKEPLDYFFYGYSDTSHCIGIDSSGNVYVVGSTSSPDFPTTPGVYDRLYNNDDIFVSKLNKNLTKLLASTFIGGTGVDIGRSLALDSRGNVYLTGNTASNDFPITPGAYDSSYDGGDDIFLSAFNGNLSKLTASTFLGGGSGDYSNSLLIDTDGNIYAAGFTRSWDFPTTIGAYDTCKGVFEDACLSKLDSNLSLSLPVAVTKSSTGITKTSAMLNGTVNASGSPTTAWYEYDTTSGAYTVTSLTRYVNGLRDAPMGIYIDGLLPKTTYYYRLVAQNTAGIAYGGEKSFFTTDLPQKSSIVIKRVTPSETTFGASITIAGQIKPARVTQVTLFFTNDDNGSDTKIVTTKKDGSFILTNYSPVAGGSWDVVALLSGGKKHGGAESKPKIFRVNQAEVTLTIDASSYTIPRDEKVVISGVVTLHPNNETTRNRFMEERLNLVRINPANGYEDVLETQSYQNEEQVNYQSGNNMSGCSNTAYIALEGNQLSYKFQCVGLPQAGKWTLLVGLDENVSFKKSFTKKTGIKVETPEEEVAGYAILVEGRVEGNSGIDSHNRTTNDIYQKLLGRGFSEEDIYYFNFYIDQEGVDEKPTMEGVKNAIETWASAKMNAKPAPLYVVMVGHGSKDVFPISPGLISASALSEAISVLESKLSENQEASKKPIVVVLGANHSGSFIEDLSKPNKNRIVITSSDAEEVAYKGPLAPDEDIRQGDYFVSEFFRFAAMDMTVKKSYEAAVGAIASFTENANGNGLGGGDAGNGQYIDKAAQHPLLDDNGDGRGTYGVLSSYDGRDGALSSALMVGKTTGGTSLELTQISDTITLGVGNETPILFAKVNDTERVNALWVEVASPHHALEYLSGATEQQVIELPRFGYDYFDESEGKFVWKDYSEESEFDNFRTGGEYEVFYFGRDGLTGDITTLQESDVFKATVGNRAPGEFCMISPTSGEETKISLLFDWSDSVDADEDEVEYNLTLSRDIDFATIDYEVRGLNQSWALVDKAAGLEDNKPYYWRVLAYDGKGGVRSMGGPCSGKSNGMQGIVSSTFTPLLTSGFAGQLLMNIRNDQNNTAVVGAIPTVYLPAATNGPPTDGTGTSMYPLLNAGTYTLKLKRTEYKNVMVSVQLYPNTVSYYVITMTRKKK